MRFAIVLAVIIVGLAALDRIPEVDAILTRVAEANLQAH